MPDKRPLTDNEGALLSLVLRQQPITGYQIGKFFESSPVHTFNTSKGKLYPMIHRLEERGLLAAEEVPDDQRGTHRFTCTEAGREVLRSWVLSLRPEHELLHDPLRKKAQAFDLLTHAEQLQWLDEAKQRLERKLGEVERWPIEVEGPFGDVISDNARSSLLGRIAWLEGSRRKIEQRGPDPA
ncbi:MAG TPA: PadR family transcriptional regulator [Allosphingosinicella sp.]|nr:PadR family transcriptional regulator [Allosphingosinicella sp.]